MIRSIAATTILAAALLAFAGGCSDSIDPNFRLPGEAAATLANPATQPALASAATQPTTAPSIMR